MPKPKDKKIKIEVSARHCHLSQKDLDILFGKDYKLTVYKKLSQPGHFASSETVIVKTPAGKIGDVRILGPLREKTQVEISFTDAVKLKINPPVRLSGDLNKSESCILVGPKGEVNLSEGVIIAKRHIHCDPKTADILNIKNGQSVSLKTEGERALIFNEVVVRISDDFALAAHIDTDEGNASLALGNQDGILIAE